MNSTLEPPSVQSLNATFGVLFIGFVLSVILYGLTFFQAHVFLSRFPKEDPWTKGVVTSLWLIDTATTALISQIQYFYLIQSFTSTFDELELTKTFIVERALATIVTFTVQMFYVAHVSTFAGRWHPCTLVIGLSTASSLAFGLASTAKLASRSHIADLLTPELEILISVYEGLVFAADLAILITNFTLLGVKPKTNTNADQHWFDRFVIVWVNRGTSVA
ncbi:hypothetical protein PHLGIDRAFT_391556 [Phlebiopsis gigantea 11061_1 CR5-6]|uniref:DUF4386 domain-containing protein n=1 Tax=Phlebiopsis gigantea (strain 11061_1 CR5-6) TaxID=745531 RepID=A0A0C3RZZ7_PHLG1|nr:hypothetical protein PHLGIDRAFT_391556 [Phlebiopsis gigantea 11061_1 CR5-6]